ncbi:MAG: excinuclease ABC subunit UvrA [Candidatus Micrarchaeia archaeon]|jgi:excinuclease ABC subunit A
MQDKIIVRGAREHNLKNVHVEIPKNKLTVFTGISGSGKSSLAFDTIYAEGQRRYVESLSAYARQFLGMMSKPDIDSIEGLSPAISIEQKSSSNNPRSTVGTITEIYDYLRLLYARIGVPHCPVCGNKISSTTVDAIVTAIMAQKQGTKVQILSPAVEGKKGQYEKFFADLSRQGFSRVRVDGELYEIGAEIKLEKNIKHSIEVVVDRLSMDDTQKQRVYDAVSTAVKLSKGTVIAIIGSEEKRFSTLNACIEHGISIGELEPRMFSFNAPFGACAECHGLGVKLEFDEDLIIPDKTKTLLEGAIEPWGNNFNGYRAQALQSVAKHFGFDMYTPVCKLSKKHLQIILHGTDESVPFNYKARSGTSKWSYVGGFEGIVPQLERLYKETDSPERRQDMEKYMRETLCPACKGARLKPEMLCVKVGGKNIVEVTDLSIGRVLEFFAELKISDYENNVAKMVLKEIRDRLLFLHEVGLDYLTLSRKAGTLSGGEAQRIRLATQIGSNLSGVLYILDEPSIGLHQRDNEKLIITLRRLRDLGNTVIVVEHDEDTILAADHVIEIGPGAGKHGGQVVATGTPLQIKQNPDSLTGQYLAKLKTIPLPLSRRPIGDKFVTVRGACENNLKNIDVSFPLGVFTCVTGVSGSGKSTLVLETLEAGLHRQLFNAGCSVGAHQAIEGVEFIDKVISIDQQPIGRTPRSNPATYIGVFTQIRELFSKTQDAQMRGFGPGRFSFNVAEGRCQDCDGDGLKKIEMHFLPDVFVTCETCKGKRYDSETLEIEYNGKNIADILDMTVEEAAAFFAKIPQVKNKLDTLLEVGLGYIKLGQSATTLSGGEAQRIKLAAELSKRDTGSTIYILDEPTTGLHFEDIKKLLTVLHRLVDKGNTIIVIEHNLEVIKTADYIIDLGPDGGEKGGMVVAKGTPEQVAKVKNSHTAAFLKRMLS